MRYTDTIKEYCDKSGISALASRSRAVVVGFSGGADSTFLLSVIGEIFPDLFVAAAHLDHLIRGDEAERDRIFCSEFCERNGIKFFEKKKDILAFAKELGKSTEEAGREARYDFFDKCRKILSDELLCSENEILVATAHNADDNLETVIFNLARGSGLRGLRGILPVRDDKYIRPLLCLTSDDIRNACASEGIEYVTDSTNLEDGYTRNRIRHTVIPALESINPNVQKTVLSTSSLLAEDHSYLCELAEDFTAGDENLTSEKILSLPPALSRRVLMKLYSEVSSEKLTSQHVEALIAALLSGRSGKLHLPGNVTAYYGRTVEFVVEKEKNWKADYYFDASPGEHIMKELGFSIGFFGSLAEARANFEKDNSNIYNELIYKICINDKIKNNLFVRNRKESDVYFFRSHHRKLKKLMCDAKVPPRARDLLPVVCDGDGIVWVPGFPPRDGLSANDEQDIKTVITYREF